MMRVLHATDIHWMLPPPLSRLPGKRIIGTANLYLAGRRHHFDRGVQQALVDAILAEAPDVLLISGDLTAQALPEEFRLARERLAPALDRFPALVQCGNHDVYTHGAAREDRLGQHFGPWLHVGAHGLARLDVGDLTIIGLNPCRPHPLASGAVPDEQLRALPLALDSVSEDRTLLLSLHYPILDRHGALYDGATHGLQNAAALMEILRSSKRKPDIITHGHVHHGYTVQADVGRPVPIFNPGAGGYAWLPDQHRAACFNVYDLAPGRAPRVERRRFDGAAFTPESGGAYATGR